MSGYARAGAVLALLLLGGAAQAGAGPAAKEKELDRWLGQLNGKLPADRLAAVRHLGALGAKARPAGPALARLLADPDSTVRWEAALALGHIDAPETKLAVRELLTRTSPRGRAAKARISNDYLDRFPATTVPHLIALLGGDHDAVIRGRAADALGEVYQPRGKGGPPAGLDATRRLAAPAVLAALMDRDQGVRNAAASALVQVDPRQAALAVPVVVAGLADQSLELVAAVAVLRHAGDAGWPPLLGLLEAHDDGARQTGIQALAYLAPASHPALTRELRKGSPRARAGAAQALALCGTEATAPALTAALADRDGEVRFQAAVALVYRSLPRAGPAVPVLVAALADGNAARRQQAANQLAHFGPAGKAASGPLRKALADPDRLAREAAALALVAADAKNAAPAVPVLAAALGEPDGRRREAARALGRVGSPGRPALPPLAAALKAGDPHLCREAAEAMVRIDRAQTQVAVPALVGQLRVARNRMTGVSHAAIATLARLGADARAATPDLLGLSADKDCPFRVEAALAVARIDPEKAAPAWEYLRAVLGPRGDVDEREQVLEGLLGLGPRAAPAVQELTALLRSRDAYERTHAAQALGGIGPEARDAVPELRALSKDANARARAAAAAALQQIEKPATPTRGK